MKMGIRVKTTEPLGYKRPDRPGNKIYTAPVGTEGVTAWPDRDDPPNTFHIVVDEPNGEHDLAVIPWVMAVQVEVI